MRPSNKSRSRNKSSSRRSSNHSGNVVNRVFDSVGPEGRVRGTPQQIIEKYRSLAQDALLGDDRVAAESFQQHAEHYSRILQVAQRQQAEQQAKQQAQQAERQAEHAQRQQQKQQQQQQQQQQAKAAADVQPEVGADFEAASDEQPEVRENLVTTPENKPRAQRNRGSHTRKPEQQASSSDETPVIAEDQPQPN